MGILFHPGCEDGSFRHEAPDFLHPAWRHALRDRRARDAGRQAAHGLPPGPAHGGPASVSLQHVHEAGCEGVPECGDRDDGKRGAGGHWLGAEPDGWREELGGRAVGDE